MGRPVMLVKKNFTCYLFPMEKQRGPARPKVAGEPQFVRLTDDLLQRVEAHRLAMEQRGEGSTKSDAMRDLIVAGLSAEFARDMAQRAQRVACGNPFAATKALYALSTAVLRGDTGEEQQRWLRSIEEAVDDQPWRVWRHGGRRIDHWRMVFSGSEAEAQKVLLGRKIGMRRGMLRMTMPDGTIYEEAKRNSDGGLTVIAPNGIGHRR